jgi:DNA topoisomerase-1
MIRVGNPDYAKQNGSFGLTTLRDRHVEIAGSTLRFAFKGKSGKEWKLRISDRRIARVVKDAQDIPGQHLFQYFDDEGRRRPVGSHDVNEYLGTAGGNFTSKHFRTWGGTVEAAVELARTPVPSSKRAAAQELNAAIDRVAAKLGNTRAVCRKCYVHPLVIEAWQAGELGEQMAEIARHVGQRKWMAREEAIVLEWLAAREKAD